MMCCAKMLLRRGDGLEVRHRLDLKEKETLEVETAQNKHLRVCFYGCDDVCVCVLSVLHSSPPNKGMKHIVTAAE